MTDNMLHLLPLVAGFLAWQYSLAFLFIVLFPSCKPLLALLRLHPGTWVPFRLPCIFLAEGCQAAPFCKFFAVPVEMAVNTTFAHTSPASWQSLGLWFAFLLSPSHTFHFVLEGSASSLMYLTRAWQLLVYERSCVFYHPAVCICLYIKPASTRLVRSDNQMWVVATSTWVCFNAMVLLPGA